MSKKINVKTVDYTVTGSVVVDGEHGLEILTYKRDGFTTKSRREINKVIRESTEERGYYEVIGIRHMTVKRVEHVATFVIDATNAEIVDACLAAGLVVRDANATDENADAEESEESEE